VRVRKSRQQLAGRWPPASASASASDSLSSARGGVGRAAGGVGRGRSSSRTRSRTSHRGGSPALHLLLQVRRDGLERSKELALALLRCRQRASADRVGLGQARLELLDIRLGLLGCAERRALVVLCDLHLPRRHDLHVHDLLGRKGACGR
jgi:hypothetical protein